MLCLPLLLDSHQTALHRRRPDHQCSLLSSSLPCVDSISKDWCHLARPVYKNIEFTNLNINAKCTPQKYYIPRIDQKQGELPQIPVRIETTPNINIKLQPEDKYKKIRKCMEYKTQRTCSAIAGADTLRWMYGATYCFLSYESNSSCVLSNMFDICLWLVYKNLSLFTKCEDREMKTRFQAQQFTNE